MVFVFQDAAEELVPRLEIILQHLMCAYGKYQVRQIFNIHSLQSISRYSLRFFSVLILCFSSEQRRNLRILYDALGTLSDAVGAELNQVQHLLNFTLACYLNIKYCL